MADADNKLSILIEILTQEVGEKRAGEILEEYKTKTKETIEVTEEHTHHLNANRLIFTELNRIVPGLGHALHAAFAGPLGPIILVGAAIAEVKSKLKEFNEELDKQGELAANAEFYDALQGRLKVFSDAASAAQGFADALANSKTEAEGLNQKLQANLTVLQSLERAQAALTSSEKELSIAKIQQSESSGKITAEQAAEQRVAIEKKYLETAQRDREEFQDREREEKERTLRDAENQQGKLLASKKIADEELEKDQAHSAALALDPKEQQKKIDEAIAEVDKKVKKLEGAQSAADTKAIRGDLMDEDLNKVNAAKQDVDSAKALAELLQKQLHQFTETQTPEAARRLKAEEDASANAAKNVEASNKLIDDLTRQLSTLNETIRQTRPIDHETLANKESAVFVQESTNRNKRVDDDVNKILTTARSTTATIVSTTEAVKALNDLEAAAKSHNKAITDYLKQKGVDLEEMKKIINELQSHQKNGGL